MELQATGYRTRTDPTIHPLNQTMDFEIALADFTVLGTTNYNVTLFPDNRVNSTLYSQTTWTDEVVSKPGTSLSTVALNFALWAGITWEDFKTWPTYWGKHDGEVYVYGKFANGYTITIAYLRGQFGVSKSDDVTMGIAVYFSDSGGAVIKGDGSANKALQSLKLGTFQTWLGFLQWTNSGELTEPQKFYCAVTNGQPVGLYDTGTIRTVNTNLPNLAFVADVATGSIIPPTPPTPGEGGDFPMSDNMPIFIFPTDKNDPEFVAGAVGTNLISAYSLSNANLQSFASILWGKSWVDDIKNLFTNPLDSIIRLIKLPIEPPVDGLSWIYLGDYQMNTPGQYRHVQQQYVSVDLGKFEIARYFDGFLDFAPYTSVSIFLPFLGFRDLEVNDVMGQIIRIVYQVDVLTGDFLAIVAAEYNDGKNEVPLYQFGGNCATEVPLGNSSLNIAGAISAGLTGITTGATLAAAGTLAAPTVASGAASAIAGITEAAQHKVNRSGSLQGNMGYTANMYPYVVITRNIPDKPDLYDSLVGQPSNEAVKLGTLSGYAEVEAVHIEGIAATDDELERIDALLKGGVII